MNRSIRSAVLVLVFALVLGSSVALRPAAASQQRLDAAAWSEDLDALSAAWRTMHPDPWRVLSEQQFEARLENVRSHAGEWSHAQVVVELVRLVADMTSLGRDGHTSLWPVQRATGFSLFPLELYSFSDGIHVIRAIEGHEDLVGTELIAIDGRPIDEVIRRVAPLVSRENDTWVQSRSPLFALIPEILGVMFGDLDEQVSFEFRAADGRTITRDLTAIAAADYDQAFPLALAVALLPEDPAGPVFLRDRSRFYRTEELDDATLYFQYNLVLPDDGQGTTFPDFVAQLRDDIETQGTQRLIIDIRNNGGGDNTTYGPLFEMFDALRAVGKLPELYAIIGRVTFSAGINFAVDLENRYDVTFVGEPTGGSPNQFGDPEYVDLPNSGLAVRISTKFWNKAGDADRRLALEPDVAVLLSAADYFARRDPVLETIQAIARR